MGGPGSGPAMTDREFAFGKNRVEDTCCPAVTAGADPEEDNVLLEATGHYDMVAREIVDPDGSRKGVIGESDAQRAWKAMLVFYADRYGPDSEYVESGREIAQRLGWDVPEEAQS